VKRYKIEIASDHPDAEEFVSWLNNQGHDASIGTSTGSYIDGVWTSTDPEMSESMNTLWSAYCNS